MKRVNIMNINKLKEFLRPWMCIPTWDSSHPKDNERFHYALKRAFNELGYAIDADSFEIAMLELLNEIYPKKEHIDRTEEVSRFVIRAEQISNYLYDISKHD